MFFQKNYQKIRWVVVSSFLSRVRAARNIHQTCYRSWFTVRDSFYRAMGTRLQYLICFTTGVVGLKHG